MHSSHHVETQNKNSTYDSLFHFQSLHFGKQRVLVSPAAIHIQTGIFTREDFQWPGI